MRLHHASAADSESLAVTLDRISREVGSRVACQPGDPPVLRCESGTGTFR